MKQKHFLLPASQVIPAMRIVLNLDSRGLRGLIMALYLDINIISCVVLDSIITYKGDYETNIVHNNLLLFIHVLDRQPFYF